MAEDMPADKQLRAAIDLSIAPLIEDQGKYLACVADNQVVVSRADLVYVTNQYGNRLLDFSAIQAPVGHNHPFVSDAIREHTQYYLRTAPVGQHVVRWPIEYARNLVHSFTPEDTEPKHKVLFTEGEREAKSWAHRIAGFTGAKVTDVLLVNKYGKLTAPEDVRHAVDVARQNGDVVIIDETKLGFGRLGRMWAQQYYGVEPHITILGGPLGGGMALGAVVTTPDLFSNCVPFVSTQAGSPVACAAGANTLRAINPGVLEHVVEAGVAMGDALRELADQFPGYIAATYGAGLWHTIEFQTLGQARQFELDARQHQLLVPPPVGTSIILTPPLIASTTEIVRGMDLIADTLLEWGDTYL